MLQYDPNFDENKIPTAIITGSGNYVGIIRKTFQIGQPFSDATVTPTVEFKTYLQWFASEEGIYCYLY